MMIASLVAVILTIIGGLNWLLVGIFDFNVVTAIFGATSIVTTISYIVIGVAGLWLIFYLIYSAFRSDSMERKPRSTTKRETTVTTKHAKA